jgi:hypothetical protein
MSSEQPSASLNTSVDAQRRQNFLSHFTREDLTFPDFRMQTRFTVDTNWMQLSVQNARVSLSKNKVQIKGFRPGKAPGALVEHKQQKQAIALALQWVINDLSEILIEDPDLVILSPLEEKRPVPWTSTSEPLVVVFAFKAWKYPVLGLDDLIKGLTTHTAKITDSELENSIFEYLSQSVLPQDIEKEILREIDSQSLLSGGGNDAANSIRRAIADNLVARILGVEATDEDLEHALGALAIEQKKSLIEIQEEMEPQIAVFRQHIESQITYATLREHLVERGIELATSN